MKFLHILNSRDLNLAGNLYENTSSKSIIILVHGFTGDKSENGNFDIFAGIFHREGFNVLAFDFSGSGESDDERISIEKETDDVKSVLNFVRSKGYDNIGLLGHSLGGLVSLKCCSNDIKAIVLTAPVTHAVHYNWRNRYTPEQVKKFEEKGYLTIFKEKGPRKTLQIDKRILEEREEVSQELLLKNIRCPVLILHGNKDDSVPYTDSLKAMNYLSAGSKLEIIEGAGHNYGSHIEIFSRYAIDWFIKYLNNNEK